MFEIRSRHVESQRVMSIQRRLHGVETDAFVQPTELIGVHTEPAHDEAYTTITKAQWAFPAIPAIPAAYDAVACSPEATARPGSNLSCREVYLAEPEAVGDADLICDVAFPSHEAGLTA